MRAFMKAVEEYGFRRRVKSDKGSENVLYILYNICFNKEALRVAPTLLGGVSTIKRLKHLSYLLCIQIDI